MRKNTNLDSGLAEMSSIAGEGHAEPHTFLIFSELFCSSTICCALTGGMVKEKTVYNAKMKDGMLNVGNRARYIVKV